MTTNSSVLENANKSLICYYTRTGLTLKVVEVVKQKLNSEIFQIQSEANYDGVLGYLKGCGHSLFGSRPTNLSEIPDFSSYDLIFIGCPVWG
jgi:flavodoxin